MRSDRIASICYVVMLTGFVIYSIIVYNYGFHRTPGIQMVAWGIWSTTAGLALSGLFSWLFVKRRNNRGP
jgi:LPXTG-motif cell wall-anchored protein